MNRYVRAEIITDINLNQYDIGFWITYGKGCNEFVVGFLNHLLISFLKIFLFSILETLDIRG